MGVLDDLAKSRAGFISLHEALETISSFEECKYDQAASWLLLTLIDDAGNCAVKAVGEKYKLGIKAYGKSEQYSIHNCLKRIVQFEEYNFEGESAKDVGEPDSMKYGFIRSEFYKFIDDQGLLFDARKEKLPKLPDASLREALTKAEADRDTLKQEVATLRAEHASVSADKEELTMVFDVVKQAVEAAKQREIRQAAELAALREKLLEAQAALKAAEDADPSDLPDELDCALMALRAIRNGYGTETTPRKRILEWLAAHRQDLTDDARGRIATVANPDKATGRK